MGYPTLYFKLLRTKSREAINFTRRRLLLNSFLKSVVILLLVGFCGNSVEYTSCPSKGKKVKYEFVLFSISVFAFRIATGLERNVCIE